MGTTKKISGKAMGYVILIGLVILSWAIFKILTPHNFGSFSNMLNYFQASLIATVGAVGFYFVMVMGMFDFSIGANIMLSAIVGCVFATRFNLGYFGLIAGCIITGAIVGTLNGLFYVKLRIPSMIVTTCLAKGAVSMSKKQTIVKNLNSIQNFGAIDILCTDKTGTLTQDKVVLEYHLNVNGEDDTRVLRHAYLNSYFQTGYKNLMDLAIIHRTEEEAVSYTHLRAHET